MEYNSKESEYEEKGRPIDLQERVMVIATKEAPYHSEGEEIWCAPAVADKMLKQKWAKKP